MKLVVGGNYSLDPGAVAMHLLLGEGRPGTHEGWGGLAALPIESMVLMRLPLSGPPGPVEELTAELCATLSIPVEWRTPVIGHGSLGTIERDWDLVEDADAILIYFDPLTIMQGGTERLVTAGQRANKPMYVYSPLPEQGMQWIGSGEKHGTWAPA